MQVRKYRVNEMNEALSMVKNELGQDAVILSTRMVRDSAFGLFGKPMLEVTAARDFGYKSNRRPKNTPIAPAMISSDEADIEPRSNYGDVQRLLTRHRKETETMMSTLQNDIGELCRVLDIVNSKQTQGLNNSDLKGIAGDILELRHSVDGLQTRALSKRFSDLPDNLVALHQQLEISGVQVSFCDRLIEELWKRIPQHRLNEFEYIKIFLARMLMKIFKTWGSGADFPRISALVGPTGVGKTTTLAKLAAVLKNDQRKNVALITTDNFRISAVDQLKTYACILGVPLKVVRRGADLDNAIKSLSNYDHILIDTAGRSQRDEVSMMELEQLFDIDQPIKFQLCLSSTTTNGNLIDITRKFSKFTLESVMFTKLDESSQFGTLLNHAIRFRLPLSYLATGQKVPEDIELASCERLVDLILDVGASSSNSVEN